MKGTAQRHRPGKTTAKDYPNEKGHDRGKVIGKGIGCREKAACRDGGAHFQRPEVSALHNEPRSAEDSDREER